MYNQEQRELLYLLYNDTYIRYNIRLKSFGIYRKSDKKCLVMYNIKERSIFVSKQIYNFFSKKYNYFYQSMIKVNMEIHLNVKDIKYNDMLYYMESQWYDK